MARFDVYENPNPDSKRAIPYLLDLQADLLAGLRTRVVAPLILAEEAGMPIGTLTPSFEVEGRKVQLSTPELAGIPARELGARVASLEERRDEILAALDLLFTGI